MSTLTSDRPVKAASGESEESIPGRVSLDDFVIEREIGRGGMATIFLARTRSQPAREVALKVIHAHLSDEVQLEQRFLHEVRAQVGLQHPNVVEMLGWGRDGKGALFMAMEYVDGPTLKELVQARRQVPADVAVAIAAGMARGLAAAHARGLVHRDVKPANVMLTRTGGVKLADFGICRGEDLTKLTMTGNVIGTPAYMSPEQALGRSVDGRSDLFSLGVVLYEMLVGGNPFQTGNPATTLSRVVHHQQRPAFETLPQTPPRLESVLDSLLDKDPGQRPLRPDHILEELLTCARDEELSIDEATLAAYVAEPDATGRALDGRRARRHFERGRALHDGGRGSAEAAIWELFLATQLDPGLAEARTWLEQVTSERGYNLRRRTTPRIQELEERLAQNPQDVAAIVQLAKLHKAQGNFLQVIFYYKRARALEPADLYTRNQIDTLIGGHAATLIAGVTGEAVAPARAAPPTPSPGPERAEGLGDLLAGAWNSWWGRAGGLVAGLVLAVVLAGSVFDGAVRATYDGAAPAAPPSGDLADDSAWQELARARRLARRHEYVRAEKEYRRLLAEAPAAPFRSEALFGLGDALERQGRRTEAAGVHVENVRAHGLGDEWARKAQSRLGELLLVSGDTVGARGAFESLAAEANGVERVEALMRLAEMAHEAGHLRSAAVEYEALLPEAQGTRLHDQARLALAAVSVELGDYLRAEELFRAVRDGSDHRSDAYRAARAGLTDLRRRAEESWAQSDDAEEWQAGWASDSADDEAAAWADEDAEAGSAETEPWAEESWDDESWEDDSWAEDSWQDEPPAEPDDWQD